MTDYGNDSLFNLDCYIIGSGCMDSLVFLVSLEGKVLNECNKIIDISYSLNNLDIRYIITLYQTMRSVEKWGRILIN
jgi:hypothetical protein